MKVTPTSPLVALHVGLVVDSTPTEIQPLLSAKKPPYHRNDSRNSLGLTPPESPALPPQLLDDACSAQSFSVPPEDFDFCDPLGTFDTDFSSPFAFEEPHPWQETAELTDDFIY